MHVDILHLHKLIAMFRVIAYSVAGSRVLL